MKHSAWVAAGLASVLGAAAALGACSAGSDSGATGFVGAGGNADPASTHDATSSIGSFVGTATGSSMNPNGCNSGLDDDADGDGWSRRQGDCNDCDANVNPGAIEVIAQPDADGGVMDPADENCDGMVDNVLGPCDDGIALDDTSAANAAKVIGLCQSASVDGTKGKEGWAWGVVNSQWTRADGSPLPNPGLQVGMQTTFGIHVNPQEGTRLLAMSSGHARTAGQPGQCQSQECDSHHGAGKPPGFPSPVPGCQGGPSTPINDDVALQLDLRAPTNATGYRFKFKFHSFEFSEFVCTMFNDQFIALVTPPPTGALNGNISFDSMMNPVSVNLGFFDVCNPNSGEAYTGHNMPNPYCPQGYLELEGTGFDAIPSGNWGGATTWLESQAPIGGGEEFQIRFVIWDAGDQNYDSTVLVDGFEWLAGAGIAVGTGQVMNPH